MPKMHKQDFKERRQAIRARRILSIQFRQVKSKSKRGGNTDWHISTTHDMSALGLAFISDVAYQIGDVLELNMVMSGVLEIYKGFGKVVRVAEKQGGVFLTGVKFVDEK